MKIENIKTEFPIFDEKIQNNDLVYLDSANSSQKPKVVADKINVSEILFLSWSILLKEYLIFLFSNLSTL